MTVTTSNFPGVQSRTSTIDRQRTVDGDTWLLDMYSASSVQEGGLTTKTKTDFD